MVALRVTEARRLTGYCGGRVEVSHNHLSVERSNPGKLL